MLIDTGASRSLCSKNFVLHHHINIQTGNWIKLMGFNSSLSGSNQYASIIIYDVYQRKFKELNCLVVNSLATGIIFGCSDLINSEVMISIFPTRVSINYPMYDTDVFEFRRVIPKKITIKLDEENSILVPGINMVNFDFINSDKTNDLKVIQISANVENNITRVFYDYENSKDQKCFQILNSSDSFIDLNTEIFRVDIIENITYPVKIQAPHFRKTLKLEPLNLSVVNVGKVSDAVKERLFDLIREYQHIFSRGDSDIGLYNGPLTYEITLANEIKDCYKERPFTAVESDFIRKEIRKLLENQIIIHYPTSQLFCGIVLARKSSPSGQKLRFCLNSAMVNRESRINHNYPLPNLEDCIGRLSNHNWYSQFDLNSAFWQCSLPKDQIKYYTFAFENKSYAFVRSSFGTRGMPSFFVAVMEDVYKSINGLSIYMDDISSMSQSIDEQFDIIRQVFEKTSEYNLTLGLPKCNFMKKRIKAFGYDISKAGYCPSKDRIEALTKLPCPTSLKRLQSAIGSLTYFHKSLPEFKQKVSVFYDLLSNFEYCESLESNWKDLLSIVSKYVMRQRPQFDQEIVMATDSSDTGGGCIFFQKIGGKERIIMADGCLHKGRMILCKASFQEFSVIHFMFKKHRRFLLLFPKIKILTDNKVCAALLGNIHNVSILKKSIPSRWLSFISLFHFSVEHKKGDSNEIALSDVISREGSPNKKGVYTLGDLMTEDLVVWRTEEFHTSMMVSNTFEYSINDEKYEDFENSTEYLTYDPVYEFNMEDEWRQEMEEELHSSSTFPHDLSWDCDLMNNLIGPVSERDYPICNSVETSTILRSFSIEKIREKIKAFQMKMKYKDQRKNVETRLESVVIGNSLKEYPICYREGKLITPREFIPELLILTHRHIAPYLWYRNLLKLKIDCQNLHKSVFEFWRNCNICQSLVKPRDKYVQTSISAPTDIGETVQCDVIHLNREKYLFVRDLFSGYAQMERISSEKEDEVVETIMKIILSYPIFPKQFVTDNAKCFTGEKLRQFCEALNINLLHSSARNSRGNSSIERSFQEINRHVKLLQKTDAPLWLQVAIATFILNNKASKSRDNFTPLELVTFRRSSFPINLPSLSISKLSGLNFGTKRFYEAAYEILKSITEKKLEQVGKVLNPQSKLFEINDKVLVKSYPNPHQSKKLLPAYSETPHTIIKRFPHTRTYVIERDTSDPLIQKSRFKTHHRLLRLLRKSDHKNDNLVQESEEKISEEVVDEQPEDSNDKNVRKNKNISKESTTVSQDGTTPKRIPSGRYNLRKRL